MTTATVLDIPAVLNLRHLIIEVQEDLQDPDPGVIADEVFNRLNPADYPDAIQQMMRKYVREIQGEQRARLRRGPSQRAKSSKSPKLDKLRSLLLTSIHTGSTYKLLGDCTAADLKAAAEELRKQASQNVEVAKQYDDWAKTITKSSGKTFGQLPEATIKRVLGL